MFSQGTATQGGFLVSLFTFIFTVFQDESKFQKRLEALAVSHAKRGIKSIEYGIIGEVSSITSVLLPAILVCSTLPLYAVVLCV